MESIERYTSLGDALEASRIAALLSWKHEYHRPHRTDDLLANDLRRVRIECDVLPRGWANVTIKCIARKPHETDSYFVKLKRSNGEWLIYSL